VCSSRLFGRLSEIKNILDPSIYHFNKFGEEMRKPFPSYPLKFFREKFSTIFPTTASDQILELKRTLVLSANIENQEEEEIKRLIKKMVSVVCQEKAAEAILQLIEQQAYHGGGQRYFERAVSSFFYLFLLSWGVISLSSLIFLVPQKREFCCRSFSEEETELVFSGKLDLYELQKLHKAKDSPLVRDYLQPITMGSRDREVGTASYAYYY
jgi:hypothetical protein